ncbi:SHOCT domain-containing protein [Salinibacterium sp. GXW1014]|uniref:SHOCT domain-containing protein n=1 Tax=Salinibacterium sp. GXW1014 TaxID=3377838 RepID=UPI00383A9B0E
MTDALTTLAMHGGPFTDGGGPGWLFFFIPLFWIGLLVLLFTLAGRRWRKNGGPWRMQGSPEHTLGDRYARGEIDETEYRSRLEVLRAGRKG